MDEPTIATNRNVDFPNLEEARLQAQNPELFAYLRNVEDVIDQLLMGRPSLTLPSVLESNC